ncbi:MAG: LytTR family DNA-binding domain-containing protein [Oscillospiraceae bacterium]|nr:LytTR family DNA-binding domain-containing protein [Oscillospiraceae bacterium]
MLQIGICDDAQEARQALRWAMERLLEKRTIQSRIYEFSSGEGILDWMGKHQGELNLVFLDIEMAGLSGMDTAHRLRADDAGLQLVFVTGYSDYVYDGYDVGALGYLLKPPKPAQLDGILTRALSSLYRDADGVYVCHNGDSFYRITKVKIRYFASDKRQIQCITDERTYTFYGKLDEVAQELADENFVRIHQRYLVNAAAVTQVCGGEVTLNSGAVLPISRSCQSGALLALTRAMLK